jgi:uncharacterized protein YqeY
MLEMQICNSSNTRGSADAPENQVNQSRINLRTALNVSRSDLKTAMKNKDANRLAVLRSLLAETTNAAKTSNPIKTDIQLLSLLRKRAAASRSAAHEFQTADRRDLEEKEQAQVTVLEEYAGEIPTVEGDELRALVEEAITQAKAQSSKTDLGTILKGLLGPGGELDGKPVDKGEVAKAIKSALN